MAGVVSRFTVLTGKSRRGRQCAALIRAAVSCPHRSGQPCISWQGRQG